MSDIFLFLTLPIAIPMNLFISSRIGKKVGNKLPYHPRFLNWIWATWGGYFWLPCAICRKNFGGYEVTEVALYTINSTGDDVTGECICPKPSCAVTANRRNEGLYQAGHLRKWVKELPK